MATPTTQEISDNIIAQLESTLAQTIPFLPKSFIRVLSKALAGVFIILYKYAGFIFLQMFVSTASAKEVNINGNVLIPIVEWGRIIGIGDPKLATNAEMTIDIVVDNQVGILAAGAQLIRSDTGVIYITKSDVALNAPVIQADIIAVSDQAGGDGSGVIGNLEVADEVSFVNPLPNVQAVATVSVLLVTGANGEDIDTVYRQRVIDRFKKRPQGGAYADYEQWAEEVVGVINAYPYTGDPGQVNIYSEVSTDIDPDGIPPSGILIAVLESINKDENGRATRRNANAYPNSLPISRTGFDVNVVGLVAGDLLEAQTSIDTALEEYFLGREPFIDGLSLLPKTNLITNTGIIAVVNSVVAELNGVFTTAEFSLTGIFVSINSYTLGNGEKTKVVNVNYI